MSLQGPILIVAGRPVDALAKAFSDAGASLSSSVVGRSRHRDGEAKPAAIVIPEPDSDRHWRRGRFCRC